MFFHCISAALKEKADVKNEDKARNSGGCLRNGGYCLHCVMFLFFPFLFFVFFIPGRLCASIFHEFPSLCLCHRWNRVKWPEQGGKCHRKIARGWQKKKKTHGKNKWVEQGSDYQLLWEHKEKSYASKLFSIYLLQMKSALEDDKPFWLS